MFSSKRGLLNLPGKLHGSRGRSTDFYDWWLKGTVGLSKNNKCFPKYFLSRNLYHNNPWMTWFNSTIRKTLLKNHIQIWDALTIMGQHVSHIKKHYGVVKPSSYTEGGFLRKISENRTPPFIYNVFGGADCY